MHTCTHSCMTDACTQSCGRTNGRMHACIHGRTNGRHTLPGPPARCWPIDVAAESGCESGVLSVVGDQTSSTRVLVWQPIIGGALADGSRLGIGLEWVVSYRCLICFGFGWVWLLGLEGGLGSPTPFNPLEGGLGSPTPFNPSLNPPRPLIDPLADFLRTTDRRGHPEVRRPRSPGTQTPLDRGSIQNSMFYAAHRRVTSMSGRVVWVWRVYGLWLSVARGLHEESVVRHRLSSTLGSADTEDEG